MWETWQRDDDDVVRAAISASKVLDLWPIPEEAREETLLRLTEAIFDMITERILDQLQARDRQMLESARNGTAHIESGDGRRIDRGPTSRPEEPPWLAGQRDQALRAIDQCHRDQPLMLDKSAHILENLIKYADPTCLTARYLVAVGDPHYNSAFGKMLARPQDAHLRFSAAETEAVRAVSKVMEERALAEGTGSAGGFAIPITIDPSVTLTGSGALNPVREVSRVLTVGTREWRGVSSDGVTAGYVAEAVEATEASPVLAQPILKSEQGRAFVPFSIELDQDWSSLQTELVGLITDARSVLDPSNSCWVLARPSQAES
jgi:predicted phage gp36 major capsid-like protein